MFTVVLRNINLIHILGNSFILRHILVRNDTLISQTQSTDLKMLSQYSVR